MPVIAICNQKGGAGKTTTAAALAVSLNRLGQKVHVIDMDPQASLSRRVFRVNDNKGMLYKALTHRIELPIVEVDEGLTLTPSSIQLASGENQFLSLPAREYLLEKSLRQTGLPEDTLVLIDCPPSLGILTFNCLTAASHVVIPIPPDELVADVLPNLNETIKTTQRHLNPKLSVLGVILNLVDDRLKIGRVFEANIGKAYSLLGKVHSESELKYAVGGGSLRDLRRSRAMGEYEAIAKMINKLIWQK